MEFYQTGMGKKFYNVDVPEFIKTLKRIEKHLEPVEIEATLGKFEEINEDEVKTLKTLDKNFDEWFAILAETFDLERIYSNKNELQSIRNLVRHGWNHSL